MTGRKTHEQQLRIFERKDELHASEPKPLRKKEAAAQRRQSEMNVSFRGMNQESQYNKHSGSPTGAGRKQQR